MVTKNYEKFKLSMEWPNSWNYIKMAISGFHNTCKERM